ncbi:KIAA1430-like protein-domain-containing protein [Zopfochytrium polystomum]|nr:KIAA1430-like protein-domain-containing protein [Zopfochytrium polystomum]
MEVLPQIAPPPGRKKEPKPAHDPFEHRHYAAFHPTCNKLLSKRWEDHSRELHYKRLRQAKSTIDNSQPRVYPHLEMRLKRLQIEEERLHEIDRKNSILLDRITFQKTNPSGVSNLQQTDWPEMRALTNAVRDHRKRRMERIQKENLVWRRRYSTNGRAASDLPTRQPQPTRILTGFLLHFETHTQRRSFYNASRKKRRTTIDWSGWPTGIETSDTSATFQRTRTSTWTSLRTAPRRRNCRPRWHR